VNRNPENAGTRDFSKTVYSRVSTKMATRRLIAHGYRQVSNTFRMLTRIDITEDQLKNFFKEKYF